MRSSEEEVTLCPQSHDSAEGTEGGRGEGAQRDEHMKKKTERKDAWMMDQYAAPRQGCNTGDVLHKTNNGNMESLTDDTKRRRQTFPSKPSPVSFTQPRPGVQRSSYSPRHKSDKFISYAYHCGHSRPFFPAFSQITQGLSLSIRGHRLLNFHVRWNLCQSYRALCVLLSDLFIFSSRPPTCLFEHPRDSLSGPLQASLLPRLKSRRLVWGLSRAKTTTTRRHNKRHNLGIIWIPAGLPTYHSAFNPAPNQKLYKEAQLWAKYCCRPPLADSSGGWGGGGGGGVIQTRLLKST